MQHTHQYGYCPARWPLPGTEFVGCSPSLSGAIRVNPWSVEGTADGLYAAIKLPREHRQLRHDKHWRYVSQHTVAYWATSFVADLQVGAACREACGTRCHAGGYRDTR